MKDDILRLLLAPQPWRTYIYRMAVLFPTSIARQLYARIHVSYDALPLNGYAR